MPSRSLSDKTRKAAPLPSAGKCIECKKAAAGPSRFCAKCMESTAAFVIPKEDEFLDDHTFVAAPELARIGADLIKEYEDFYGIRHIEPSIDYLWKQKGGKDLGNRILGKVQRPTGELKFYSHADFIVWLAADHCFGYNRFQITAIIFHELLHIFYNEAEVRLELRGHHFEGFPREVEIFGCWRQNMVDMSAAFKGARKGS